MTVNAGEQKHGSAMTAECALCVRPGAERFQAAGAGKHGFVLVPLQSTEVRAAAGESLERSYSGRMAP